MHMSVVEFRIGDAFPADDELTLWACGLALALNDLVFAHIRMEETEEAAFFYYWRLAIGHYWEAMLHLERFRDNGRVAEFVETLPPAVQGHYVEALALFDENRALAARIRNEASFHYPYASGRDAMLQALNDLEDERSSIQRGITLRESRLDFADEIIAKMVETASGGDGDSLARSQQALGQAVAALIRFTNGALDGFLVERL